MSFIRPKTLLCMQCYSIAVQTQLATVAVDSTARATLSAFDGRSVTIMIIDFHQRL